MPTAPEIGDTACHIGVIEVFEKFKTDHLTETDSHIRISREIEIDLEGVANNDHPAACNGGLNLVEGLKIFRHRKDSVCKEYLFGKTCAKTADTLGAFFNAVDTLDKLIVNISVSYDRACDKLREQCDVCTERHEITLYPRLTAIQIDGIRHYLEGIEGYTNGKRKAFDRLKEGQEGNERKILYKEIAILEEQQENKVGAQ